MGAHVKRSPLQHRRLAYSDRRYFAFAPLNPGNCCSLILCGFESASSGPVEHDLSRQGPCIGIKE